MKFAEGELSDSDFSAVTSPYDEGADPLDVCTILDEVKRGRFVTWLREYGAVFDRARHLYKPTVIANNEYAFALAEHFIKQMPQLAAGKDIQIGNAQFRFEPDLSLLGGSLYPAGLRTPLTTFFVEEFTAAQIQSIADINRSINGHGRSSRMPSIVVYLPEGFEMDGVLLDSQLGWVKDFGPFTFFTFKGIDGLPGRLGGHFDHEAWHEVIQLNLPNLYWQLLRRFPHLDEALAMIAERYTGRVFRGQNCGKGDLKNPLYPGLPGGMIQSYLATLTLESVVNPLSFENLDGGQIFQHDLYAQRLLLSYFISVTTRGAMEGGADNLKDNLRKGLTESMAESESFMPSQILVYLFNVLKALDNRKDYSLVAFWQELTNIKDDDIVDQVQELYRTSAAVTTYYSLLYSNPVELSDQTSIRRTIPQSVRALVDKQVRSLGLI